MFIDHRQEQWPNWLGTAEFAKKGKREFNYDKQVEMGSNSSQLHAKWFVGRRRKWGYQKEIKK